MPDSAPTLIAEQRARDLTYAIMRHYGYTDEDIIAAEATHPGLACGDECGDEDGLSKHLIYDELTSTASLMVDVVEPLIARMVADAEQRGRELGSRAEAALWRQQIEDRDRSGIMALDRQLAEEEGYERGQAQVSAAVEAVLDECERRISREPDRVLEFWVQRVRASLTDPAAAVARIKAEAGCELQRSGDGTHGPLIRQAKAEALYAARDALYCGEGPDLVGDSDVVYGEWLGNRADRIGGDA